LNDILTEKLSQSSQVDHLGHENIKPEINKNYVDLSSFKWQYKLIKDKSSNMLYYTINVDFNKLCETKLQ